MWIRRVTLRGFGCFSEGIDIEFREGVNIVLGPNESGKTTLMESIVGVIYGLPTREAEEALRPRGVHRAYAGEVVWINGEAEYRVSRDFETNRVTVTRKEGSGSAILFQGEANPRGRTDDIAAYLDIVESITGIRDRDIAVRTLFINQGDMETAVDDKIRHLLSGTQVGGFDRVLVRLEEEYGALTRENPWGAPRRKDREIEELDARIEDLTVRIGRAREALSLGGYLLQEMDETARMHAEAREQVEEKSALCRNYGEFFEVNRERSDLEKRLRTLRDEREKVKALTADCRSVEAELWPRYNIFRNSGLDLGESLRLLAALQRDVESMKEDLMRRESELETMPWPRNLRNAVAGAVCAALLGFAGMAGAGAPLPGVAVGFLLGLLAFFGVFFLGKGKEKRRLMVEGQVVELADRLEKQKSLMTAEETELAGVLQGRRPREVMEEFRHFREKADLLSRYEQIRDSHRSVENVEADYDDVFQKLKLVDARARDLIAKAPFLAGADEDPELMSRSMEIAARERESVLARCSELEGRLEELKLSQARSASSSVEDVEAIEEDLAECAERKKMLAFRRDALGHALAVLRESIAEFQESHLERLTSRAGNLVRKITAGRHDRLVLDRNFVPVLYDVNGVPETPGDLSQGARDQLYLALRRAIGEELSGGARLPLLMDDVLVNCDAARLAAIRELLFDPSAPRQVILFTHDPGYSDWGHALVLDEGGDAAEPGFAAESGGR